MRRGRRAGQGLVCEMEDDSGRMICSRCSFCLCLSLLAPLPFKPKRSYKAVLLILHLAILDHFDSYILSRLCPSQQFSKDIHVPVFLLTRAAVMIGRARLFGL